MASQLFNISGTTEYILLMGGTFFASRGQGGGSGYSFLFNPSVGFLSGCDAGEGILYIGESNGNIHKSSDYGQNWVHDGTIEYDVNRIMKMSNGNLLIGSSGVGPTEFYGLSVVESSTYNVVYANEPGNTPLSLLEINGKLLSGDMDGDLYSSNDFGASWSSVSVPASITSFNDLIKTL